jgi:hypothetical protein
MLKVQSAKTPQTARPDAVIRVAITVMEQRGKR